MATLLANKPLRALQHGPEVITQNAIWTTHDLLSHCYSAFSRASVPGATRQRSSSLKQKCLRFSTDTLLLVVALAMVAAPSSTHGRPTPYCTRSQVRPT